ncbi:hypothetical protein [Flavobacterium aquicola]|nr:hypothetical protein [Flavobacterium aquicola]
MKISAVIYIALLFSCSNDTPASSENNTSKPSDNNKIKDDFSYLAVNASGKIQKIGNNTGKISTFSQFEGLNESYFVHLNNITTNSEKIFLINHISPSDKLYIFDKKTKTTISKELVFPKEITGFEPTLTSIIWDESKKILYGIIVDNPYSKSPTNTCYFIKINPNNFTITYEGLTFNQTASSSAYLNNNKVYSSYLNDGFTIEIDLVNNTAKKVLYNNAKTTYIKPIAYDNNMAYCFRQVPSRNILTKLNLSNNTYEDVLPNESFYSYPPFGNGFIDKLNDQYICFMTDSQQFQILKYNISTKTFSVLKITSDSTIDSNLIIIDKIDN